jgi:hypothetical protein
VFKRVEEDRRFQLLALLLGAADHIAVRDRGSREDSIKGRLEFVVFEGPLIQGAQFERRSEARGYVTVRGPSGRPARQPHPLARLSGGS